MCKKAEEDGILVLVMALMILVTSFEIQETKMNEMGSLFQFIIKTPPHHHTCKKREIAEIYLRKFFWIFRKILG